MSTSSRWRSNRKALALVGLAVASWMSPAFAQVPGDGVPDLYYFPADGTVETSFGQVARPRGTLLLDTDVDGSGVPVVDVVAILVGGPDVSNSCDLCDGSWLPMGVLSPGSFSVWTVGHINDTMQWIRTHPLTDDGFKGVIGTGYFTTPADVRMDSWPDPTVWPTPTHGLANYPQRKALFPKNLNDPNSGQDYSAKLFGSAGAALYVNVTILATPIFADGFESGNLSKWSQAVP